MEIPTSGELALVGAFRKLAPRSRDDLAAVRARLNLRQADLLQVFAMRMATFAAERMPFR